MLERDGLDRRAHRLDVVNMEINPSLGYREYAAINLNTRGRKYFSMRSPRRDKTIFLYYALGFRVCEIGFIDVTPFSSRRAKYGKKIEKKETRD